MTHKNWWYKEGSGMRPLPNEDIEEFAKRITEIAWSNGEYKEREAIKDEFWLCVQSDLENGVNSLNEKAFKNFVQTMPELSKFGGWLETRGQK
jgi:hypothetical protein